MTTLGWDIGGVNTKVARVAGDRVLAVRSRPFELQRDPAALVQVLRTLATESGASTGDVHAVTMTAELSQMFRTKREGVSFVLDSIEAAFPGADIAVYAVDGRFLSPAEARAEPLAAAAANWAATARLASRHLSDALLVDIGTTSTDIIPIVGGDVAATGWTDPDRLASGELVYTGAVRTPVEAIAPHVPYGDGEADCPPKGSPWPVTSTSGGAISRRPTTPLPHPMAGPPRASSRPSGLPGRFAPTGRCWTPRA